MALRDDTAGKSLPAGLVMWLITGTVMDLAGAATVRTAAPG